LAAGIEISASSTLIRHKHRPITRCAASPEQNKPAAAPNAARGMSIAAPAPVFRDHFTATATTTFDFICLN
jgi:hypothetical protein